MSEIDLTRQPTEPPPVSALAAKLYQDAGRKLDDAAFDKLQEELDKLRGDNNGLFWSFVGLEAFNQVCIKLGDKPTGDKIWAFVLSQRDRFPEMETNLRSLSQDRAQATQNAAKDLTGAGSTSKEAPVFGKAPPKGTTRLSDLIPQTNLRPPVPRKR